MEFNRIARKAFDYHCGGFHCAEAVSKAIIESYSDQANRYDSKVSTGFGGGIGLTKQRDCGAFTGGVIALGFLYGRNQPNDDLASIAKITTEFKNMFIKKFRTINCGMLLDNFGPQENMMRCKQLSGETTQILSQIIENELYKSS